MPIILGLAAVFALGYMAVSYPKTRMPVAALLGVALIGLIVQYQLNDQPSPAAIGVEDITLSGLTYDVDPRLTTLSGRITNNHPELTLTRLSLRARTLDCTSDGCTVIGDTEMQLSLDVPAGQARAFSTPLRIPALPELNGTLERELEMVSATGRE